MPDELAMTMPPPVGTPGKPGPALSATNDMPQVDADPPPLSEQKIPGQAKAEAAPAPEPEEAEATEPEALPGETPAPRRSRTSERIRELNERAKAAEATAAALAEALRNVQSPRAVPVPAAQDDPKPRRQDFDDPDAYEAATVGWAARDGARTAMREYQEAQRNAEAARLQEQTTARWTEAVEKVADKYPDFHEVVYRDDVQITIPMFNAIVSDEVGPDIAYYLGQNPNEAARIAKLGTPAAQGAAIGRLAAKLGTPVVRVSRAPPPIRPPGSRNGATERAVSEMSMEEYAAKRNAEMAAERAAKRGLSTA